jgi:NQR2, RnfD, RnfE family
MDPVPDERIDWTQYCTMLVPAGVTLVIAGLLLYGFPALACILVVLGTTWASVVVWRRIGWRGRQLRLGPCLWMALLLSLMLPANLLSFRHPNVTWPVVPAAGILLVIVYWFLTGLGSGRVHAVLATYLALVILFHPVLIPHNVLRFDHVLAGNLFDAQTIDTTMPRTVPWIFQRSSSGDSPAIDDPSPAGEQLGAYTSGRQRPDRAGVSLQMLLRDQMPPLEDLILGGQPGPIGISSAIAVIMGGLLLLYRGLIDYRIPLLAVIAAYIALLVLPVPVVITDTGTQWHWLAFRPEYLGWPVAITFVNYEMLASPLLFVVFFLATSPQLHPSSGIATAFYAILLGLLCAPAQLYGSVDVAPYIALFLACMITPTLDHILPHRSAVAS